MLDPRSRKATRTPKTPAQQLDLLFGRGEPVADPARGDRMPTKAEGMALVRAGAYDAPPGVRFEIEAWTLVSSVTVDGPHCPG